MQPGKPDDPPPADLDAWKRVIAAGGLSEIRPEAIVAAIQTLGPDADQQVLGALMLNVTDRMTALVHRLMHYDRANRQDIIERTVFRLIEAVLEPESADGVGLRTAFYGLVKHRTVDAIRVEDKRTRRERSDPLEDENLGSNVLQTEPWTRPEESAHVELMLDKIGDPRKRLAMRLFMEDCPVESKSGGSIADVLGVSPRTAAKWVKEAQEILKKIVEDGNG